jgi:hypothetical protein
MHSSKPSLDFLLFSRQSDKIKKLCIVNGNDMIPTLSLMEIFIMKLTLKSKNLIRIILVLIAVQQGTNLVRAQERDVALSLLHMEQEATVRH